MGETSVDAEKAAHSKDQSISASPGPLDLRTGEVDPDLNKLVYEIVLATETFVVYLDSDLGVQWKTYEHEWDEKHGEILNRVALLETRSRFLGAGKPLYSLRRQVAEGLVRYLDGNQADNALVILGEAEFELESRNREVCWDWYFRAALWIAISCGAAIAVLWVFRGLASQVLGPPAFEVLLGTLCGAIGAFLSATTRSNRLYLDANAGEKIHVLEGLSRIGVGLVGAAIVALAIKSGALLGGMQFSGNRLALLLVFCLGAGASERMVPNLIGELERAAMSSATQSVSKLQQRSTRAAKRKT